MPGQLTVKFKENEGSQRTEDKVKVSVKESGTLVVK